ncbi:hypothetical protein [Streptomyces reniochalinae]|uniref:PH domain-containing protein n=1 Tax=Streptomyces reniochalinae TaxID=2250578 RepID=A0A367EIY6_9ACTN|nr:hypothetical protein [Streptomyces reniochalinae]RCG17662.1 hypothetical protein DQ392_17640 [Streptomyces reniochalinae]
MAKRNVHRRARKLLGEDPVALVWCEIPTAIPKPPKDVHRAAGKGRLSPGHHWLFYVGAGAFFFIVVPMMLLQTVLDLLSPRESRDRGHRRRRPRPAGRNGPGCRQIFDGDWSLTAGRLLLGWYGQSPNPKRLVLVARDRICVAASPGRRLTPTKADDFQPTTQFSCREARIEAEAGQPRGFATFRLRFADGSWLELGRLADPEDADHFLRVVAQGTIE